MMQRSVIKHILTLLFTCFLLSGCKKTIEQPAEDLAKILFEQNILNKDFIIQLATDNTNDITTQFVSDTFRLLKNTYEDGPLKVYKNGEIFTGTWACTENYGKLTITLPTSPNTELGFLNRSWRFTSKDLPVMKLAPWGVANPSPTVLEMRRLN